MVFCDFRTFFKSVEESALTFIGTFFERFVRSDRSGSGIYAENFATGKEDGISPFFDSGRNLDCTFVMGNNQERYECAGGGREVSASFTVEAAFVMAIVLFVMGFVIKKSYILYDEVTGAMILEESLENTRYNEADAEMGKYFAKKGEQQGNPRLWLGQYEIIITETDGWVKGGAGAGGWQTQIEMRRHDPKRFLRRIQALLEKRCMPDDGSGI